MSGSVADSPTVLRRGRLSLVADGAEENAPIAALSEEMLPEGGNQPARSADDPWFANAFQSSATPSTIGRFVPEEPDEFWLLGPDMEDARSIVFLHLLARPTSCIRIDWSRSVPRRTEPTRWELGPPVAKVEERAADFVDREALHEAIVWLLANMAQFFPGASFQLDVLDSDEGEEALLAVRTYGDFSAKSFRERRHRMCEAILAAGFTRLHQVISIFQRSEHDRGRQILSWYSSVSVE